MSFLHPILSTYPTPLPPFYNGPSGLTRAHDTAGCTSLSTWPSRRFRYQILICGRLQEPRVSLLRPATLLTARKIVHCSLQHCLKCSYYFVHLKGALKEQPRTQIVGFTYLIVDENRVMTSIEPTPSSYLTPLPLFHNGPPGLTQVRSTPGCISSQLFQPAGIDNQSASNSLMSAGQRFHLRDTQRMIIKRRSRNSPKIWYLALPIW